MKSKEKEVLPKEEQLLRETDHRFDTFVKHSAYGYFEMDLDGRIQFANKKIEQLAGYKLAELYQLNIKDFLLKEEFARAQENLKKVLTLTSKGPEDYRIRTKQGQIKIVQINALPILKNKTATGYQCTALDVTDHKQTEALLRESEEKFQTFIRDSAYGYIEMDFKGNITFANRKSEEITGYRLSTDKKLNVAEMVVKEDRPRAIQNLQLALTKLNEGLREYRLVAKDGRIINIEINTYLRKKDNTVIGYSCTMLDITARKETEEKNRQHSLLLQSINTMAVELAGQSSLRNIYQLACRKLQELTGAAVVGLSLYDADKKELVSQHIETSSDILNKTRELLGRSVAGHRLKFQQPVDEKPLSASIIKLQNGLHDLMLGTMPGSICRTLEKMFGLGDAMVMTLRQNQQFVGSIGFVIPKEKSLGFLELLDNFSAIVAVSILRKQAEEKLGDVNTLLEKKIAERTQTLEKEISLRTWAQEEIKKMSEDILLVNAIHTAVSQGQQLRDVLRHVNREIRKVFAAYGINIYFLTSDAQRLTLYNIDFLPDLLQKVEKMIGQSLPDISIPLGTSPQHTKLLQSDQPLVVNDPATIRELMAEHTGNPLLRKLVPAIFSLLNIKSAVYIPLVVQRKTFGLLSSSRQTEFTASEVKRLQTISRELTTAIDKYRTRQALAESEERYRALVNQAIDGIIIIQDDLITFANKSLEQVLGYPATDAINTPFSTYVAPEERGRIHDFYQKRLAGQTVPSRYETVLISKTGDKLDVEINAAMTMCEGKPADLVFIRNISRFKTVERELRESRGMYQTLVEATPEAIMVTDVMGIIISASPRAVAMHGYAREQDLIGRPALDTFAPEDRERAFRVLDQVANEGVLKTIECAFLRQDGSRFIGEINSDLIKDDTGRPKFFIGVVRDITDRKEAEDQIRAALKEKEVLLNEVHHRVKNNLQIISSLLNLQSRSIQDPAILELFHDSANRVKTMALIHEKLYQAKNISLVDFADYVRSMVYNLFRTYGTDTELIKLQIEVHDLFLSVNTAVPCGLIINELVTNSLKYAFSPGGPGEIRIKLDALPPHQYRLTVGNNGHRLPEGFDFRTTTTLGIQLVCTLTEQLGGTISLDRDTGTIFTIVFTDQP